MSNALTPLPIMNLSNLHLRLCHTCTDYISTAYIATGLSITWASFKEIATQKSLFSPILIHCGSHFVGGISLIPFGSILFSYTLKKPKLSLILSHHVSRSYESTKLHMFNHCTIYSHQCCIQFKLIHILITFYIPSLQTTFPLPWTLKTNICFLNATHIHRF